MYNINSPIVQSLINNTPSGGMGNMGFVSGPAPRIVESVVPTPQFNSQHGMINVSPYPDPYTMVTGIGMQNYAMPYNAPLTSGVVNGIYTDINQPVNSLPISGYSNPYMGFGTSFGTGYYMPQYYIDPEDQYAQSMGFANSAEMMINDLSIERRLSKMACIGAGYDQEYVDKFMKEKEKNISKAIDDFKNKKKPGYNLSPDRYESKSTVSDRMTVTITKGDMVLADSSKNRNAYIGRNNTQAIDYTLRMAAFQHAERQHNMAGMYACAPERQLDNEDCIDFFNCGINIVHHRDKELEWNKTMQNSKRLYDSEEFKRHLIEYYGSPQDQLRYEREQKRAKKKKAESEARDKEKGLVPATKFGFFGDVDPDIAAAFKIDPNTGETTITVPDFIDTGKPLLKGTSLEKEYEKKMENIDDKIDDFLDEYVSKPRSSRVMNFGMTYPYYGGYGSNMLTGTMQPGSYSSHYQESRERFFRELNMTL